MSEWSEISIQEDIRPTGCNRRGHRVWWQQVNKTWFINTNAVFMVLLPICVREPDARQILHSVFEREYEYFPVSWLWIQYMNREHGAAWLLSEHAHKYVNKFSEYFKCKLEVWVGW